MDDGARQLRELARDLDRATNALRKELPKGMRRATVPMIRAIRAEAKETLPERGGFAEYIAKATISTIVRTGADNTVVKIRGRQRKQRGDSKQVDMPAVNRGRLRHPTYGHGPWVTQLVPAGFWDNAVAKSKGAVDTELRSVMDDLRRRIETGA